MFLPKLNKALAALAIFVISILQSGCVRSTPTPEPITITFFCPDSDNAYYQKKLQQFNELYPHITIDLRSRRGDMFGGIGPGNADVFVSSQFAQTWLKEEGNILDLTPFIEQDQSFKKADFYAGTIGMYSSEGKIWGVPAGADLMVMYYNRDLFDQQQVSYPHAGWNWDDFLSTAMLLRAPEAGVFGYVSTYGVYDALLFIYQHGGRIFDDLQNPTSTTFDDPLNIEALDWYVNLVLDSNVAPTSEQMQEAFGGEENVQSGIRLGKVGMWPGLLSERRSDWMEDMRVGMAPLPVDKQAATLTLIEGYFVSARTEHADACWEWISFLSQQIPDRTLPVRKSLLNSKEFEQQEGSDLASLARDSMENALLLSPELAQFEEALNAFSTAFDLIMKGQSTPLEAMTTAQQNSKFK